MSSYIQMGHDTENLVGETDLNEFKGIILSPLNREPAELMRYINEFRSKDDYDIILDPQLYFPRTMRGKLQQQPYFPSDIDTADISSSSWWKGIINRLYDYSHQLQVNALASPTILPKVWSDDYFSTCSDVSQNVSDVLSGSNIRPLTTVLIHIGQLSELDSVFKIASILSEADSHGYYIVFESDVEPRREFTDSEELYGAMCLIRELENTGRQVIVSQCSSDMILFKAAGAANCATSKFFNLRRFTKSRYDEEKGSGGGQLPYWFEHSLLAFLREEDILRLKREGYDEFVGTLNSGNHWANEILEKFRKEPGKPWVALSWMQYLSWFGKTEADLSNNNAIDMVKEWLKAAEELWLRLDDNDILFDEPRNNGAWLRPWRQALIKFSKDFRDIIRL